ncbi:GNAT family N-acetyltransferase [Pseudoalteromonas sp. SG43-4]|uniref:GNAT family N-acetyltransferase n=1 Tax=Pseudoalteromonas sp. SG43-4 TaxID=2760969 RepID=UPI0016047257|nr:GNAT family N-acetyltransferase [Pseudoalteromonas sp. SG43-4]MBB1432665.1 GNAT family N-acetyltransferase [Pseudoalteromonas sp. SG43-4]
MREVRSFRGNCDSAIRKNELKSLSDLISSTVNKCIDADVDSLKLIIDDTIACSKSWLAGDIEGVHLVYKHDSRIVGTILVIDYWNMASLFVLPEFHGRGIAKKLVDIALKLCRDKYPNGSVKLNSSKFASSFYKNYGFVPNGESKNLPGGFIPYVYNF